MTDVLSLPDAERLAERTLAAIGNTYPPLAADTDRERVASDLAGLRRHASDSISSECQWCLGGTGEYDGWPCADARSYSDGLRRTAALYGVT